MGKMQNRFNVKADGTYSYHSLTVIKIYSNSIYTFYIIEIKDKTFS
jgi:hypothetical protein